MNWSLQLFRASQTTMMLSVTVMKSVNVCPVRQPTMLTECVNILQ